MIVGHPASDFKIFLHCSKKPPSVTRPQTALARVAQFHYFSR